jgi:tripartite-type tricarboxylate transporter receptor subunit TctC
MKTITTALSAALLLFAAGASAQNYPDRPIRMVVPYTPGGAIDVVARRITQDWIGKLGQQIVVDNRGGAGGTIGSEMVAKAPPNGYTILYGNIGPLSVGPHVYKELGYDVFKDFAPVSIATSSPFVLFVSTKLPLNSVKELIAYAKERPGQLNYASSGMASGLHLTSELFARIAGVQLVHIPFKGIAPAVPEFAAGRVHLLTYPPSGAEPHVKSGLIKPLMVAGPKRSPRYPDIPTSVELGMSGFNSTAWHAVMAPARTPQPIVQKLQQTLKSAVAAPELVAAMAAIDVELVASTPEELAKFLKSENDKWGPVVRAAGIKPE